jgi:hypothetical protein
VAYLKGEAGEGEALEEGEIAKLRAAIDSYVINTDPYATLQVLVTHPPLLLVLLSTIFVGTSMCSHHASIT